VTTQFPTATKEGAMTATNTDLLTALAYYEDQAQLLGNAAIADTTNTAAFELAFQAERDIMRVKGQLYAGQTWTSDSTGIVDRTAWCDCATGSDDVRYEAYDRFGLREAHGYCCATCRKITQTG
jgi:hypothetical protein